MMNSSINHIIESDPIVGTLLDGRYLINFLVARGGMGNIYHAHDVRRGHVVALKMLRSEFNGDPLVVQRFQREAIALSKLSHENICRIFDSGCTPDGLHYFAMEFLEGEALDAILKKSHTLPPNVAIRYIIQVAAALNDAHNHGIIHRDLKPANIFIVKTGNAQDFVKVLDFGVARIDNEQQALAEKLTNAGSTLGTPFYMSPEQIQGFDVDGRTDVYALGIILWETLFGTPPYVGSNLIDVFSAAVSQKLPKLPAQLRHYPTWRHIYAVLQKALQKNRDARYRTMLDFQRALEKLYTEIRQDTSIGLTQAVTETTPRSLHALNLHHLIDVVHSATRHVSPLQLLLIGTIACVCLGCIIATIVIFTSSSSDAPQNPYNTYKFFSDVPATVRIDSKELGTTPLTLELNQPLPFDVAIATGSASHVFHIDATSPDVNGFAVNLDLRPDAEDDFTELTLETTPSGARVKVESPQKTCISPCTLDVTNRRQVSLSIQLEGYRTEKIIAVPNGRNLKLRTNLFRP